MNLDRGVLDNAGFDSSAGLKVVGGKVDRYAKLLQKFADHQSGTVGEIRAALETGDSATAERAAHSLKGAAATLGALALAVAAADAEAALKTGRDPEEALRALAVAVERATKAIAAAVQPENEDDGDQPLSGDPRAVVAPLARLKQLLETDDSEAADFVIDAKPQLTGVLTPGEIKMLSAQVGNFEFDAALESLSSIASRLSIDLGVRS